MLRLTRPGDDSSDGVAGDRSFKRILLPDLVGDRLRRELLVPQDEDSLVDVRLVSSVAALRYRALAAHPSLDKDRSDAGGQSSWSRMPPMCGVKWSRTFRSYDSHVELSTWSWISGSQIS